MKKYFTIFYVFFISISLTAQNSNRIFKSFSEENQVSKIEVNDGTYFLKFYDDEIVETAFIPTGETYNPTSHAVVLNKKNIDLSVTEKPDFINISSEDLTVKIQKNPFQISYYKDGELLLSEKKGYQKNELETIDFNLTPDEVLYGAGSRAVGMNRRGKRYQLYNRAHYGYGDYSELLNFTMPIVLSSKQYLLHFDNAPIGYLDFDSKKDNTLAYETISGRKVYQVVTGKNWEKLIENYTDLTGKQPMLPRWALGNFSSRFGYRSQKETVETIQKFRDEKIPVDAVIIDLYWFGKEIQGTLGNFEFDKETFPQPQKMVDDLRKNNVETILITEPFVLKTSKKWDEAVQKRILGKNDKGEAHTFDFYFGTGGIIDIYDPKGYIWFKDIYTNLLKMNVTGIWGDLGEPEAHPSTVIHANGTADEVHNIYGHDWARLVQDAFHSHNSKLRPFILMRAGYSGSQRYGIVPWTGDVGRSWGGLKSQPEISLQMGMQGIAFMGSDLGGFAGDYFDDELYVRWLQYGVFQPIYRPHAGDAVPSEPVFRNEKTKQLSKKAIELRYQMLPYNYQLIYENSDDGTPLMKPLFFEEPDNKELFAYADSYLWGNDFLVSPIVEAGKKEQNVYFPAKSNWYDFYTGEKYSGGNFKTVKTHEEYILTFVRGGAIIPLAKPMQSTKEYTGNDLILNYYYDSSVNKSKAKLYNDDGLLNNAEKAEQYEEMEFEAELVKNIVIFEMESELGDLFSASDKTIELNILHLPKQPKSVKTGWKRLKYTYQNGKVKIPVKWNSGKEKKIKIKL